MSSSTSTSTIAYASFLNLFGIIISVILCILFLILGGHTLKYIKQFACKIKIIMNRAHDKEIGLKDFNYQHREKIMNNPSYQKWEIIFKNEIKKSRSLEFKNIFGYLMGRYDHMVYWIFRDKTRDKYDLLKPKLTFYSLLVITSCCIAWMISVFLTAILQNVYNEVSSIPTSAFIAVTIGISIISSILNLISINRLFRIYLLNVKNAFKVQYGHQYLDAHEHLNEQDDDDELKQQILKIQQYEQDQSSFVGNISSSHRHPLDNTQTMKSFREDNRLLQDTSSFMNIKGVTQEQQRNNEQSFISGRKRAIKDVLNVDVNINGVQEANSDEKYLFIEDKHAIGDMDLLNNESDKGENKSNITTFVVLFLIIAAASAVCCYLNYQFPKLLALYVFFMFTGAFIGDLIVIRPLILLILALFYYLRGLKRGYRFIQYKKPEEIRLIINHAIKDMFKNRQEYKTQKTLRNQQSMMDEDFHNINESRAQHFSKIFDQTLGDQFNTQKDHNSGAKQLHSFQEEKDYERNDIKKQEFNTPYTNEKNDSFFGEQFQSLQKSPNYETQQFNTQSNLPTARPLFNQLHQALKEREELLFAGLSDKKHLTNDLADYNLLLFRKIYDAYEERADKVLQNFRTDKNSIIRKRYMVPVLNPNYDYDKFVDELKMKEGMQNMMDNSLFNEEEFQKRMDLMNELWDRLRNGEQLSQEELDLLWALEQKRLQEIAQRLREIEEIAVEDQTLEEQIEHIDLQIERLQIEANRIERKQNKSDQDIQRLEENEEEQMILELEKLRLKQRNNLLTKDEQRRMTEIRKQLDEKRLQRLRQKLVRNQLTKEEFFELLQLIDQYNVTDLNQTEQEEILKLKKKYGLLSQEEIEQIEVQELLQKMERQKTLKKEEIIRLRELQRKHNLQFTSEQEKLLQALEKKYGLKNQEQIDRQEAQNLLKKLNKTKTLGEEEVQRLRDLQSKYGLKFTKEEENLLSQLENKYGIYNDQKIKNENQLNQNNQDESNEINELENLLRKLRNGTINQRELDRLQQLLSKHNKNLSQQDKQKINDLEQQMKNNQQRQSELDQIETLRKKLMNDEISAAELVQLGQLCEKHKVTLTKEEQDKIKQLSLLFQNDHDLRQLDTLRKKLATGDINYNEIQKLKYLANKLNKELTQREKEMISKFENDYQNVLLKQKDKEEFDNLLKLLMSDSINEDQLQRLLELQQKYNFDLTTDQQDKLDMYQQRLIDNDNDKSQLTDNDMSFAALPPIEYMDKTNSPSNHKKDHGDNDTEHQIQNTELTPQGSINSDSHLHSQHQSQHNQQNIKQNEHQIASDSSQKQGEEHNKATNQLQQTNDQKRETDLSNQKNHYQEESTKQNHNQSLDQQSKNDKQLTNNDIHQETNFQEKKDQDKNNEQLRQEGKGIQQQQDSKSQLGNRDQDNLEKQKGQINNEINDDMFEVQKVVGEGSRAENHQQEQQQTQDHDSNGKIGQKQSERNNQNHIDLESQNDMMNQKTLKYENRDSSSHNNDKGQLKVSDDEFNELNQYSNDNEQSITDLNQQQIQQSSDIENQIDSIGLNEENSKNKRINKSRSKSPRKSQKDFVKNNKSQISQRDNSPSKSKLSQKQNLSPTKQSAQSKTQMSIHSPNRLPNKSSESKNKSRQGLQGQKQQMNKTVRTDNNGFNPIDEFNNGHLEQAPTTEFNLLDESVYSHHSTEIIDEEKVSFMHLDQVATQDVDSEDSFDEQDMVYYNKDDVTNYSKDLKLNRINKKNNPRLFQQNQKPNQSRSEKKVSKYYSESDLQMINENKSETDKSRLSKNSPQQRQARSQVSQDSSIERSQQRVQEYMNRKKFAKASDNEDQVDGKVKVDSWNLNYKKKKKKALKRKNEKNWDQKIGELSEIYGVNAQQMLASHSGAGKKGGFGYKAGNFKKNEGDSRLQTEGGNSQYGSTQNTFMQKSNYGKSNMKQSVNDNASNMFSFNGNMTRSKWNDLQSTIKGQPRNSNLKKGDKSSNRRQFKASSELEEESKEDNQSRERKIRKLFQGGDNDDRYSENSHEESDEAVNDGAARFQRFQHENSANDSDYFNNQDNFNSSELVYKDKQGKGNGSKVKSGQNSHNKPPLSNRKTQKNDNSNSIPNLKSNATESNKGDKRTKENDRNLSDGESEYIVGPHSRETMIKMRDGNGQNNKATFSDDEENLQQTVKFQKFQGEDDGESHQLRGRALSKPKTKKASQSENNRTFHNLSEQLKNERLKKLKDEQEKAFNQIDEENKKRKQRKIKSKKQKKEVIKKEINYWLDYDSPYAEFLVARFREWSPNPSMRENQSNGGSNMKDENQHERLSKIKNAYKSKSHERKATKQITQQVASREKTTQENYEEQEKGLTGFNWINNSKQIPLDIEDFEEP